MEAKVIGGDVFFDEQLKDFEAHGASASERVRTENPLEFLRLIAAIQDQRERQRWRLTKCTTKQTPSA
jgi:hypothetical protein